LELILCGKNIQSQKHFNDVPLHRHTVVIDLEMATDAKGRTYTVNPDLIFKDLNVC
jgi:stress response protein YsnF